jgi:hypothetical protein
MVLLAQDRETLAQWGAAIVEFLREHLKLELRPDMLTPFPVGQGIDFVGWKTWWNRRVPRRRTLSNVRARLDTFERIAVRPVRGGSARRIDLRCQEAARNVARLRSVMVSYAGHLHHGAAWRAWEDLWKQYPWLAALFARRGWVLDERWSGRRVARSRCFQSQYWQLVRHAGDDCLIFCQVGRFIEFYGPQRLAAAQALGLHAAALPRAGYAFTVGFPARLSGLYAARALRQELIVVEVHQAPVLRERGCIPRLPCTVLIPTPTRHSEVLGLV